MAGLLKIGQSTRPLPERIAELGSATGVPAPFEVEAYFVSDDTEGHERQIHAALAEDRVNGKEFFEVPLSKAVRVAESICKKPSMKQGWTRLADYEAPYDSEYEYRKRSGLL